MDIEQYRVIQKKASCTCKQCVAMCKQRPCWPTPEDARLIIDAGYGDRLMCDYYINATDDFDLLCPAIIGYEGCYVPFWPIGICTFLKNERCELHQEGLKPTEGREAWHGHKKDESRSLHHAIGNSWENEDGQRLVRAWLKEHGLYER